MTSRDPYRPGPPFEYECAECTGRVRADRHPGTCADCGAVMLDVSVSRE